MWTLQVLANSPDERRGPGAYHGSSPSYNSNARSSCPPPQASSGFSPKLTPSNNSFQGHHTPPRHITASTSSIAVRHREQCIQFLCIRTRRLMPRSSSCIGIAAHCMMSRIASCPLTRVYMPVIDQSRDGQRLRDVMRCRRRASI